MSESLSGLLSMMKKDINRKRKIINVGCVKIDLVPSTYGLTHKNEWCEDMLLQSKDQIEQEGISCDEIFDWMYNTVARDILELEYKLHVATNRATYTKCKYCFGTGKEGGTSNSYIQCGCCEGQGYVSA